MGAALFGGMIADPLSGHFISEKHRAIAGIIQDWNPELSLVWIPPDARQPGDEGREFGIIHTNSANGIQYVVHKCSPEDVNESLVAKLYEMDTSRSDVLSRLEYMERATALTKARMEMERAEERAEIAEAVLKSPKHTYTLENGRKIRS